MNKRLFSIGFVVAAIFIVLVVLLVSCSQTQTTTSTQVSTSSASTHASTPTPTAIPEPTATPELTPTPEPTEVPDELYATAYTSDNSANFSFYKIDNEYYRNVQQLWMRVEDTDYLSNVYVYVPDVFGLSSVQVDKTADKGSTVGVTIVDMNGNVVSGESLKGVMENGGAIILDALYYEQIYQIRLITDVGTYACNIKIS